MKKFNLLFISLFSLSTLYAQDISDAIRFSESEIQGTARFRALSGAFGALGGDMSAVSINPASSAVFTQSHASFSLSSANADNNSNYFNSNSITNESTFDIHQAGAAFVFESNTSNPWRKFTLGIAYDKTNNFNDNWMANGIGKTSIDRYFLDITENINVPFGNIKLLPGEYLEDAYADIGTIPDVGYAYQQVFLGYWGGIINPANTDDLTNDNNVEYVSILNGAPYNHNYSLTSNGYNGKVSFNFSTQYEENLYLGINLNSHFIDYSRSTYFSENNDVIFENKISTIGSGFSFQLGSILKLTQDFRVGLSYDSPTWYTIGDETTQSINSLEADQDIEYISNILNIYPRYKLQSPGKTTGSIAYVFGKKGLLSFDYSTKNYGRTKFLPTSDWHYSDQNSVMTNTLTRAATYRVGGEYKIKQFSLRGGYRFEESPYKNSATIGDLTGYSLGLGYNFGNTKLDLTYDGWTRTDETPLYNVGLVDTASIERSNNNVTLSLSFNL